MKTPSIPPLGVRMPQEMKDRLKEAAARNHRSLNGEIVARLAESLGGDVKDAGESR
ncbi:Arc family DNA-binding protein [Burkholderia gladioli]|uniref:Arc family DNA-binding protein n=1 Tax=Burkholderia gladioli TaxID=28095 RepID=UPI00163E218F